MPSIRARFDVVLGIVTARASDEVRAGAGANTVVSRAEEAAMSGGVAKDAIATVRAQGGAGARVTVAAATAVAIARASDALTTVNSTSGGSATYLTQSEIKTLATTDGAVAAHARDAYEQLTGTRIPLAGDAAPTRPAATLDARLGAVVPAFKLLLRTADANGDARLSHTEARTAARALSGGRDIFSSTLLTGSPEGMSVYWTRSRAGALNDTGSPTMAQLDATVDQMAREVKAADVDGDGALSDLERDALAPQQSAHWLAQIEPPAST